MASTVALIDLKFGNVIARELGDDDALEGVQPRHAGQGAEAIRALSLILATDDGRHLVVVREDLQRVVGTSLHNSVA